MTYIQTENEKEWVGNRFKAATLAHVYTGTGWEDGLCVNREVLVRSQKGQNTISKSSVPRSRPPITVVMLRGKYPVRSSFSAHPPAACIYITFL